MISGECDLYFVNKDQEGIAFEEKEFMMKGGKSTFLGFSIKGAVISESESLFLSDNILCILKAKKKQDIKFPVEVSLDPIIAGKKGVKINSVTKPFIWDK